MAARGDLQTSSETTGCLNIYSAGGHREFQAEIPYLRNLRNLKLTENVGNNLKFKL